MSKVKSTKTKTTTSPTKSLGEYVARGKFRKLAIAEKPAPSVPPEAKEPKETKLAVLVRLLSRPEGATLADLIEATGWQPHTVRAALSHALGKKRSYQIVSDKPQGGQRIYKIAGQAKDDH
ncbi:MAG: DUF3489 domain-containing protein [Bdellovibrionales bacterium]